MSEAGRIIGRGRSGAVYTTENPGIVEKRFKSWGLARGIQTLLFGAPAYDTDEDAVNTTKYKRLVLPDLCEFWFDGKLRVAKPKYVKYDEKEAAFTLGMEFVRGRAPSLLSPFQHDRSELTDLLKTTEKFQAHLDEAGFVGTEWQAGNGNPVALNNYLMVLEEGMEADLRQTKQADVLNNRPPDEDIPADYKWATIDCESGVPPYAPISLRAFFYYIKQSIHLKRLLFDDVDIKKLRSYVSEKKGGLIGKLGQPRYDALLGNVNKLEENQNRWKSKTRVERGITYQLKKRRLSQRWADWYSKHPFVWYGRGTARLTAKGLWKTYDKLLGELPFKLFNKIAQINYVNLAANSIKFVFSERYRVEMGRKHVRKAIGEWKDRKNLDEKQADSLEQQLERSEFMEYIGDLWAHAMIYPIGKGLDAAAIPYFFLTGNPYLASFIAIWGTTPFLRVGYTGARFVQSCINGKEKPWWAFIGILPTIGNFAYPLQMTISAGKGNQELPMFLIIRESTKIGEKLPILGGKDTLTEHYFNHFGYKIGRYFGRRR